MDSNLCYNCGNDSHESLYCSQRPQYQLCDICFNICSNQIGHRYFCNNKKFISKYAGQSDVEIQREAYIVVDFKNVERVSLITEKGEVNIDERPLYLQHCGLELKWENSKVIFVAFTPTKDSRAIIISDEKNSRRMQISTSTDLTVNNHYKISDIGEITYNMVQQQSIAGPISCWLKVYTTEDIFRARVKWFGTSYIFDVYANNLVFIDPVEHYLKKQHEAETDVQDNASTSSTTTNL